MGRPLATGNWFFCENNCKEAQQHNGQIFETIKDSRYYARICWWCGGHLLTSKEKLDMEEEK